MPELRTTALQTLAFAAVLLAAAAMPEAASARQADPPAAARADHAAVDPPLSPFTAAYSVHRAGRQMGEATLRLVRGTGVQWRMDLGIRVNRGLLGLAGLDAQQSTVFVDGAAGFQPLSQGTVRQALFLDKRSNGRFDWNAGTAQWSGDIGQHRRQPVTLRAGDMSGLLVNLAVVRDARPGVQLTYRVVDNGRAREHRYAVSAQKEGLTVNGIDYLAMRVQRTDQDDEQTVFWIADGVPTPIRILKREDGKDVYDLQLVQYQGA
ncbi:MAG: DUF3108 domain-containing protein [Gammaproteobacteria bacterium]